MTLEHFDVRAHAGKMARLEILDDAAGGWGNIGVGKMVAGDQLASAGPLEELPDFGTMALALLGETADQSSADATAPFAEKLSGTLGRKLKLAPMPDGQNYYFFPVVAIQRQISPAAK